MIKNIRNSQRRRGATLIELSLAIGLTALIVPTMIFGVLNLSQLSARYAAKAKAEVTSEQVMTQTRRALIGARGLGHCLDNLNPPAPHVLSSSNIPSTPIEQCKQVGEYDFTLAFDPTGGSRPNWAQYRTAPGPTKSELCVWSYNTSTAEIKDVPSLACVYVDPTTNHFIYQRFDPTDGASYTNPNWKTTGLFVDGGEVDLPELGGPDVFSYYDSKGCKLTPAGPGGSLTTLGSQLTAPDCGSTSPQIARVALVQIHPTITYNAPGAGGATLALDEFVQLSGATSQLGR